MKNNFKFGKTMQVKGIEIHPKIIKVTIENIDMRTNTIKDLRKKPCSHCNNDLVSISNDGKKLVFDDLGLFEIDSQFIGIIEEYNHYSCMIEFYDMEES